MHFRETRETRGKQRVLASFLRTTGGFVRAGPCTPARVKNEARESARGLEEAEHHREILGAEAGTHQELVERRCFGALQQGVARLQALLLAKGMSAASGGNELADRPIQETGAR